MIVCDHCKRTDAKKGEVKPFTVQTSDGDPKRTVGNSMTNITMTIDLCPECTGNLIVGLRLLCCPPVRAAVVAGS